ncbi:hypothetical protein JCM3765_000851 [Sporobolomyces pararoseus]
MEDLELPFSEPIASTSRAIFTLPYKPPSVASTSSPSSSTPSDPFAIDPRRKKLYEKNWNSLNFKIQQTLSNLNDQSLNEIVKFVLQSNNNQSQEGENDQFEMYKVLTNQENNDGKGKSKSRELLKTGLILGASSGTSSFVYNSLIKQLEGQRKDKGKGKGKGVLVSRLNSRDCGNSIKNCLRSIISGFISQHNHDIFHHQEVEEEEDDEEGDDQPTMTCSSKSSLIVSEDLNNLLCWYKHEFKEQEGPTLVILLEDLESFPGKILNQLIKNLYNFQNQLPIVLLLGIATTPQQALYNLLPLTKTLQTCLDIKEFQIDHSGGIKTLNTLIENCFINYQPRIGFGNKSFQQIFKFFKDLDGSIDRVISFLNYSYLNHFLNSPLALLLLLDDDDDQSISEEELKELIKTNIPSLNNESSSSSSWEQIKQLRKEFPVGPQRRRRRGFKILIGMVEFWEKSKKFSTQVCLNLVLGAGQEGGLSGGEGEGGLKKLIDELCELVLKSSGTKLPLLLKKLINLLKLDQEEQEQEVDSCSIHDFLSSQLKELQEKVLSKPKPKGRTNLINLHLNNQTNNRGPGSGPVEEIDQDFSRISKQTSDRLREELTQSLKPFIELPGSELFYCDDSFSTVQQIISKRLNPNPLPTIFKTLSKLDHCPLSHSSEEEGKEEEPEMTLDLAISFRVYKELNNQGRLINLGDWWSGFQLGAADEPSISTTSKKNRKRSQSQREEEQEEEEEDEDSENEEGDEGKLRRKQARFLRTVADLSHLGFVGPSTRKPEHLLKYVY